MFSSVVGVKAVVPATATRPIAKDKSKVIPIKKTKEDGCPVNIRLRVRLQETQRIPQSSLEELTCILL